VYEPFKIIKITITIFRHVAVYEHEEPYHLCNTHLRTWRAYNSTEDSQRARMANNKGK